MRTNTLYFTVVLLSAGLLFCGSHGAVYAQYEGRGWDGQYRAKMQPQGVYPYRIAVTMEDRAVTVYEGNVTLVR